ncbi:MAG: hypothetical protein M1826_007674 [Phylliscum demangeonii]|nr:MAG: hypothetical protein M1826_007674 [Phylliscum demangeonii]
MSPEAARCSPPSSVFKPRSGGLLATAGDGSQSMFAGAHRGRFVRSGIISAGNTGLVPWPSAPPPSATQGDRAGPWRGTSYLPMTGSVVQHAALDQHQARAVGVSSSTTMCFRPPSPDPGPREKGTACGFRVLTAAQLVAGASSSPSTVRAASPRPSSSSSSSSSATRASARLSIDGRRFPAGSSAVEMDGLSGPSSAVGPRTHGSLARRLTSRLRIEFVPSVGQSDSSSSPSERVLAIVDEDGQSVVNNGEPASTYERT